MYVLVVFQVAMNTSTSFGWFDFPCLYVHHRTELAGTRLEHTHRLAFPSSRSGTVTRWGQQTLAAVHIRSDSNDGGLTCGDSTETKPSPVEVCGKWAAVADQPLVGGLTGALAGETARWPGVAETKGGRHGSPASQKAGHGRSKPAEADGSGDASRWRQPIKTACMLI